MFATFYTASRDMMANGHRFRPAAYTCAAPYNYRLGDVLDVWIARHPAHVRLVVTDRGRLGAGHLDLAPAPFRALAGRHWRKIGVLRGLHCRVVRRGRAKRHGRRRGR